MTAFDQLSALLGTRFTTAQAERDLHGASEAFYPPMPPDAVAFPETTDEVSAILAICHASGTPVTAWGAGTSLEGHALAARGGIVLDTRRMNRLVEVRPEDMLAVVQPGLTRIALNTELRATGLFFPVDPGADASLGGMAATRASGTTTVRYGSMRDNVRAMQVVLADGTVIRTGTAAAKTAAGYDLTALMLGSEGTLGIITELTLRLHGQPEEVAAGVCAFPSIEQAVETVILTIQSGIEVARVEFVDAATVRAFNATGESWPETPHLMVEFHGTPASVAEQAARFGDLVADAGGRFDWATDPARRTALWAMRHGAYPAILRTRPGASAVVTDVCVPISRLAEAVAMAQGVIAEAGIEGPILGHVGDGNFHAILMVDKSDAADVKRAKAVAEKLAEGALALGGTISGEHGIGIGKRAMMAAEHGPGWAVMGAIKQAFDPRGILNPGKLVP
ncbi:FAD-binding oxidoreductase [Paracoccus sp. p4-l81]|uniref:FAD-binding oxidoreductase n=1 Tax=Paracoccus sp. p4-l81 TaxID=3342806 RepID=UPI0035B75250